MIVTDHFVYIHVSRSAGTFLNKLILNAVPGARMLQYHGHLGDLPEQYSALPVIGFVRNPWDWYVSMFFDYRRKAQFVYRVLSDQGTLEFEATVERLLRLGDGSAESRELLDKLIQTAPEQIATDQAPRDHKPGLTSSDFASYGRDTGYYSWLFRLMFESDRSHEILIGRFENVRSEALRLFEETGTPVTDAMTNYLETSRPLNASSRPRNYARRYTPELAELVAVNDRYIVDRFGYSLT